MQRSTPEALDIVELPDEDEVETACYDGGAGVQKGKQEKGIVVIEPDDKDEGHPESPPSGTVYDKANTGTESGMMEASQNYLYEKSFYDYFGLKPDATRHLIKKAFKRQVAEAKAVRDSSISDQDYDLAQDQVRFLEAMYKILRDSDSRAVYDKRIGLVPEKPRLKSLLSSGEQVFSKVFQTSSGQTHNEEMKLTAGRTSPESLEETRLALDARTASHANCTSRESGEHDPAEGGMPLWTSRTPRAPGRVPVAPKVFQRRPATHQNQEDHSSAISQIEGTRALENAVERRGHCTSHHDRARHSHPAMAVSTEEIAKSMVLAKEGRHRRCHDHGFQQASSTTSSGSAAYSGDGVRQETCAPTLNSLAPYAAHVHLQPGQAGAPESRVCKPPSLNLPGRMEGPINLSSSQALTRLEPENSAAPPPLHNRLALPSSNLPMMPSPSNSLAVPQLWRVNGIAPHLGSAISAAFKPPTQMTFSVSNASFTRVQTNVRWNSNTGATSGSQSLQQVQRDAYGNMEMNSDYREFQWQ